MDVSAGDKIIIEWDEDDVQAWFSSLGYSQYESQIRGGPFDHLTSPMGSPLTLLQNTTYLAMFCACLTSRASKLLVSPP